MSSIAAAFVGLYSPKAAMFIGTFGSVVETLALRHFNLTDGPTLMSDKFEKCGKHARLPALNSLKQWELKNFALLSLLIPFSINLIANAIKSGKRGVAQQFSLKNAVYYTTLFGFSLGNALYSRQLGLTSSTGFDSSGHVMLKTVTALAMGSALATTATHSRILSGLLGAVYALSDGVFLKNTLTYCHTRDESIAGLVWGATIIAISSISSQFF
jgi:hypothetical protein